MKINVWGCIFGSVPFIGVFFPWATASASMFGYSSSFAVAGKDISDYGILIIITGVLCVCLSLFTTFISKKTRALGLLLLGTISAIDLIVFIINRNNVAGSDSSLIASLGGGFSVSIGIGVWVSLIGAAGTVILGISGLNPNPVGQKNPASNTDTGTWPGLRPQANSNLRSDAAQSLKPPQAQPKNVASSSSVNSSGKPQTSASAQKPEPILKLQRLKEMLDKGLINQQDYDEQKKKIIETI